MPTHPIPAAAILFLACALPGPTLRAAAPEPPRLLVKDLERVPGPMTRQAPDPARYVGSDTALGLEMRHNARSGSSIPARAVPSVPVILQGSIDDLAGWQAFRIQVAPRGALRMSLKAGQSSWFVLKVVDKWGQMGPGMLQNLIPRGAPVATYRNPTDQPATIYLVVDTTETDLRGETYELSILPEEKAKPGAK